MTEYLGPWVFENNQLQFLQHSEGRVVFNSKELVFSVDGSMSNQFVPTPGFSASQQTTAGAVYTQIMPAFGTALTRGGVSSIGYPIPVIAGERYLYRVKGYGNSSKAGYLYVKGNGADLVWEGASLPVSAGTESWVETEFTIPSGVTQITLGLYYNGGTAAAADFLNVSAVELNKLTVSVPEYQYYLKDHLGTVRATFTTKDEQDVFTATLEDDTQTQEQNDFQNYSHTTNDLFDHTDAGSTYYKAQVLNGGNNSQIGLANAFSVVPGDVIKAEVYAKYLGSSGGTGNLNNFATALLSAFSLPAPVAGETGTASAAINDYGLFIASGENTRNEAWPKGYLNILIFDKDYNFLDVAYQQLDGTYVQPTGTSVKAAHQLLSKEVTISEPGYVYVYLSNEGNVQQEIYFDDFKITHTKSPVIQVEDYYPFGLTSGSYSRESMIPQNYQYNGKEKQDELDLGTYDFQRRQYDPTLGRFTTIDPLADVMRRQSPYNFAFDNPMRFTDPDGMSPFDEIDPGDEGWIKVERNRYDKNGRKLNDISFRRAYRIETTVTIHNVKVLNKSNGGDYRDATESDIYRAVKTMTKEIKNTWNGTTTDSRGRTVSINVNFTGQINIIDHESQAKESEFLIVIAKNGESGSVGDENGTAQRGSNKFTIDYDYSYLGEAKAANDKNDSREIDFKELGDSRQNGGRIASHEFGHNGIIKDHNHGGLMNKQSGMPIFDDRWNFFRGR